VTDVRIRLGTGWTAAELVEQLERLRGLERNFEERSEDEMTRVGGWRTRRSEALVARESPGRPLRAGPFAKARDAITGFAFSDPSIVRAHFDAREPLIGRRMLLDLQAVGMHILCGTIVAQVRDEVGEHHSAFGFRYDTLQGHPERGVEWFVITKDHATGELRFVISSRWRDAEFPNWWSHAGFLALAPHYRRLWLRRAHERLAKLIRPPLRHVVRGTPPSGDFPLHE
jgi:uncharacterized protein (UPF0548 family)